MTPREELLEIEAASTLLRKCANDPDYADRVRDLLYSNPEMIKKLAGIVSGAVSLAGKGLKVITKPVEWSGRAAGWAAKKTVKAVAPNAGAKMVSGARRASEWAVKNPGRAAMGAITIPMVGSMASEIAGHAAGGAKYPTQADIVNKMRFG